MSDSLGVPALVWALGNGLCGAVLVLTTWAAARGWLRLDQGIGVRTRQTMSWPQAWVAGHRAAWPWASRIGIVCLVGAAGSGLLAMGGLALAGVLVGAVTMVSWIGLCVPAVRAANQAASQARNRTGNEAAPPGVGRRMRTE